MLLKYLDIQGFKSFPDKTRVSFGKGLTAVVGPNGSGKSNISDAVRWVMGEQSTKTLRGSKMEDVIFAGTKLRKSQGFAEVSLTVDNTARELAIDSDEVMITRRYDRSGESEYMINRGVVRLKDLQEFLMDTGLGKDGYSLVGQGKIAEIVQSKSNERREIFEEAAGISKFRYRKNESERSLERAEENLVRLRDIMSELEGRVGPLKEQSEKAKQYLSLSESKKKLEVSLWIDTLNRSNLSLKDQSDKILASTVQKDEIEAKVKSLEEDIQSAFTNMQNCLVENEALRGKKEILEAKIADITSQIAVCENNIEHNKKDISRVEESVESYKQSGENAKNDIENKKNDISNFEKIKSDLNTEIDEKQRVLLETSEQSEGLTTKEIELTDEINQLLLNESQEKMTIATSQINLKEVDELLLNFESEESTGLNELKEYERELKETDELLFVMNENLLNLQNTYAGHKIKLENRTKKLESLKQECDKSDLALKEKEQKIKLLEGMEQSLDGFAFSVKEVLKLSKNNVLRGVLGTLSQLIEVKEEYSVAIETALGGALQNIVVENENDAKSAIRALNQGNLGRATFLPLTSIKGNSLDVTGLDRYAGYVDVAKNLVKCDKKYADIVGSFLGKIVVVDDIDTAVLIAQKNGYRFRIVTLDGQVVNAGGSLTGGSKNKGQSFLSRKNEITSLKAEVAQMSERYLTSKAEMSSLLAEVSKIEAEFAAVTSEMTTINEDKIRIEGESKRLNQLHMQLTQSVAKMTSEQNTRKLRKKQLEQANGDAKQRLLDIESLLKEKNGLIAELKQTVLSTVSNKSLLADEISALKIKGVEIQKDIEAIISGIELLEQQKTQTGDIMSKLTGEIEELNKQIENENSKLSEFSKEIGLKKAEIVSIGEQMSLTIEKRQEYEASATALRRQEREIGDQKEKIASEVARLEEKKLQMQLDFDNIIAKLWDEYELTRSEAQELSFEIENPQKSTSELNSMRNKIKSLGSVNVDAIEEYKEVSERYEFLSKQISDVEKSRNELQRLINELTAKMQDIFAENFEKINGHFQSIFTELFGGGTGTLKLTDPDDLLQSGIEIFVEPPGKIIKNLASLSGGEQALVAIAIYFAIFKVRPAPFCILDEIEAALDDVNVDKYAAYLRSISDNTQFIMITHRRGSMEAADVLYGVTMQDEGVSKLLELNVAQIEQKLNMKI